MLSYDGVVASTDPDDPWFDSYWGVLRVDPSAYATMTYAITECEAWSGRFVSADHRAHEVMYRPAVTAETPPGLPRSAREDRSRLKYSRVWEGTCATD